MIAEYISEKAPLFYYSFRQVHITNGGKRETNAADKVIIQKNKNYRNNGLQFLVQEYNKYGRVLQSDAIMQTIINNDTLEHIDFLGDGISKNRKGEFHYKKDLPEVTLEDKEEKEIIHYLNFYSEYNDDVFELSEPGIVEFIRSTGSAMQGVPYNPFQNIWYAIRAFVLSYYSKLYNMNMYDYPGVSTDEWNAKESTANIIDCVSLLSQLEELCDSRMLEALRYRTEGNIRMFKYKMEHMVDIVGTYYILYRTLTF